MNTPDTPISDAELIKSLGGPTKLAELLGYDKASGGVQRVQNWTTRGIPAAVKLQRPDLFIRSVVTAEAAPARITGGVAVEEEGAQAR
ncbi:hypothetical protein [Hydrogenophaga sp. T2]|uniref:hypothetical protein n=1 Tax=Hydrogenophaga sp. T2 TaxID=3132823 RepID=UPI003CECCFBC